MCLSTCLFPSRQKEHCLRLTARELSTICFLSLCSFFSFFWAFFYFVGWSARLPGHPPSRLSARPLPPGRLPVVRSVWLCDCCYVNSLVSCSVGRLAALVDCPTSYRVGFRCSLLGLEAVSRFVGLSLAALFLAVSLSCSSLLKQAASNVSLCSASSS